jgi:exosortase
VAEPAVADPPYRPSLRPATVIIGLLGLSLLWAYWPVLCGMERHWASDPRYSHGYLVPGFSLFLLWLRRGRIGSTPARAPWWALTLILAGMAGMLSGQRYFLGWVESASLLPCLAGLSLLAGGWPVLRWAWPSIAFLVFMFPLPYRAEVALGYPLQRLATLASTYVLQTVGMPALAEGNVILLPGHVRLGVAEACNGLGMLLMFLAYSTAAALVISRPLLDRVLVVLSAVPIALAANVTRIVVTGVLQVTAGPALAGVVYHDLAGWLMMPFALATLWVELRLLSHLLIEPTAAPAPDTGTRSDPLFLESLSEGLRTSGG